jgi:hypothetical protein
MGGVETLTKEALVDGREYLESWFESLAEAEARAIAGEQTAVLLYAYRLSPAISPEGRLSEDTLLDQLKRLTESGCDVDVRLSHHLAGTPNHRAFGELVDAGIPVKWSPGTMRRASHEKFCVIATTSHVDLFTGSVDPWNPRWDDSTHSYRNDSRYGRMIAPSHDLGIRLRLHGLNLVDDVRRGRLSSIWAAFRQAGVDPIHRIGSDPSLFMQLTDLLKTASESIYIEDQYFLPDIHPMSGAGESLLDILKQQVSDGVNLTVVLPGPSRTCSVRRILESRSEFMVKSLLTGLGEAALKRVQVIGRRALDDESNDSRKLYVHSKLVAVDDRDAIIGSNNFTTRSIAYDSEFAVRISDSTFVSGLKRRLLAEHVLGSDGRSGIEAFEGDRAMEASKCWVDLTGRKGRAGGLLTNFLFRYAIDPR